jgi:hypothetical protein
MFGAPKVRINSLLKANGFRKKMTVFFKNLFSDVKVLPFENRTLVVSHTHEDVFYKIYNSLKSHESLLSERRDLSYLPFMGTVSMSSFRLVKNLRVSNSFVPVMNGQIEATRTGCLIFVRYRMFASSLFMLIFHSLLFASVAAYLCFAEGEILLACVALFAVFAVYLVALLNFYKLVKTSHSELLKLLS